MFLKGDSSPEKGHSFMPPDLYTCCSLCLGPPSSIILLKSHQAFDMQLSHGVPVLYSPAWLGHSAGGFHFLPT